MTVVTFEGFLAERIEESLCGLWVYPSQTSVLDVFWPATQAKREGWGEGKKGEGLEKEGRSACYKNPLLFISADAGVRKFLIG